MHVHILCAALIMSDDQGDINVLGMIIHDHKALPNVTRWEHLMMVKTLMIALLIPY
jgi:hypothetical protein